MDDTPSLALARIASRPAAPHSDVPLASTFARRANPLLISEASEYVQPIERPDASTIARPDGYYGGSGGNQLGFGLTGVETLNRSGNPSRASPLGQQASAGQ